jgi:hypothetical protein
LGVRFPLPGRARARAQRATANHPAELFRVAGAPSWPGYIGSPRLATAAHGAQLQQRRAARNFALADTILDGADDREFPRDADVMVNDKTVAGALEGSARHDAAIERKQRAWLTENGLE